MSPRRRAPEPIPGLQRHGRIWRWAPPPRLRAVARSHVLDMPRAEAETEALRLLRAAERAAAEQQPAKPQRALRPQGGDALSITLAALATAYKASREWGMLSPRTQAHAAYELRRIVERFGDVRAARLTADDVTEWLDPVAATAPETARHLAQRGRALYGWALSRGRVRGDNPFAALGYGGGGKRGIYCPADALPVLAAAAETVGCPSLYTAFLIGFYGIMRATDALAAKRDWLVTGPNGQVRLVYDQSKRLQRRPGGHVQAAVTIDARCPGAILKRLTTHPPRPTPEGFLVVRDSGKAARWDERYGAAHAWRRVIAEAVKHRPDLKGLQLRDARRSGFIHAYERHVPLEHIRALSGHSLATLMQMAEHYFPRLPQHADAVVAAMDGEG